MIEITNKGKEAEIKIIGDITDSKWESSDVVPADFINELDKVLSNRPTKINLKVHSYGGSVFAGQAIVNSLRQARARCEIHAEILGVAASTASWVVQVAHKVSLPSNGFIMTHRPQTGLVWANIPQLLEQVDLLGKIEKSVIEIYGYRKVSDPASLLTDGETWFRGKEALDRGLVDEITDEVMLENRAGIIVADNAYKCDISRFKQFPFDKVKSNKLEKYYKFLIQNNHS